MIDKDDERELIVRAAMREVGLIPECTDAMSAQYRMIGLDYYDIDYDENDTTSVRYDKIIKRLDTYITRLNNGEEK